MSTTDANELIRQAVTAAGSDDFGPTGLREGLERNLEAMARVPLKPDARRTIEERFVVDMVTRLQIIRWNEQHSGSSRQAIEGPVLVFGMPRTGTTATVAMLALDERFRFLRGWEGAQPLPPPIAGEEDADPRVIAARSTVNTLTTQSMHLHDPDGPEEDLVYFAGLDMRAFHGSLPMPRDYLQWWIDDDFASTYAVHAQVLQALQSRRPPHLWLLKAPPHLFKLEAFAKQYPNAKFVMTHRDPRKLIPSVASLSYHLHCVRCHADQVDKHAVGAQALWFWSEGIRRGLAARARIGEHRFIDVPNDEVVKTPLAVFERIYDHLDMELTPAMRQRVTAYGKRNAPGAFGEHRYTLEEYGLTAQSVGAAFKDYLERFAL